MDDLSKASVDCGRRNSDPNLAQSVESNTLNPAAQNPDTSSSSIEMINVSDSPQSNGNATSKSSPPSSASSSPLVIDKNALRNELDSCPRKALHDSSKDVHAICLDELNPKNSPAKMNTSSSSPLNGTLQERNSTCPAVSPKDQNRESSSHNSKICNGDGAVSLNPHSPSSSPSSTNDDKLTSLLSHRLAADSNKESNTNSQSHSSQTTNGFENSMDSTETFHSISSDSTIDSHLYEEAISDEQKLLVLKQQAQQMMKDASSLAGVNSNSHRQMEMNGLSKTVSAAVATAQSALPSSVVEDGSSSAASNGCCLNSKSTDTLVGDEGSDKSDEEQSVVCGNPTVTIPLEVNVQVVHPQQQSVLTALHSIPVASCPNSHPLPSSRTSPTTTSTLHRQHHQQIKPESPNSSKTSSAVVAPSWRARTVSGASLDSAPRLSPGVVSGNWTDTGRLRHPSGGGEVAVRHWIGSSVSTSTSDISDSCIGKVCDVFNTLILG